MTLLAPALGPWQVEIVVVSGASHSGAERRALSRDVERGLWLRLGPGRYVSSAQFTPLGPEGRQVVRMRAVTAGATKPVVFSHWSAAVLHRLPVLRQRLDRVHVVIESEDARSRSGVVQHVFPLRTSELVRFDDVWATTLTRTVLDIAGSTPLDEGVIAADAALVRGIPRSALTAAADLAGPRHAARRIAQVIAFAHPGAESPAESRTRVSAYRLGVEAPELQHRFVLSDGSSAFADEWFPGADAVLEIDGLAKYLDPALATDGTGMAVLAEKRREDEIRGQTRAFARAGWTQASSPGLLRPVLARIGVRPTRPPTTLEAYCAAAAIARPRRSPAPDH